jgi:hypothetical protein
MSENQPTAANAAPAVTSQIPHDPRYPIGRPQLPPAGTIIPRSELSPSIRAIAELPEQLRNAVEGLDSRQLATPYREGGWTVQQLVHHIADSHMVAFGRIRLALTEDWPAVPGYREDEWARLHDSESAPIEWSLGLLENLHARWVMLLLSLSEEQWERGYVQDGRNRRRLSTVVLIYGWHSLHHVAHITHLRAAKGW